MNNIKINEKIIKGIKEKCEGDKVIEKFLIDLLYEETTHSGQWQWNEIYKKQVDKYSKEWEKTNEN